MGGGTQLFDGAHLTGGIRAFVVNQANGTITGRVFWLKVKAHDLCGPEMY